MPGAPGDPPDARLHPAAEGARAAGVQQAVVHAPEAPPGRSRSPGSVISTSTSWLRSRSRSASPVTLSGGSGCGPVLPRGPSAGLRWGHARPGAAPHLSRHPRKDAHGHRPGPGTVRRSRAADPGVLDAAAADQPPRPPARPGVRGADRPVRAGPRTDRGLRPAPGHAARTGRADRPDGRAGRARPAPAARLLAARHPLDQRRHRSRLGAAPRPRRWPCSCSGPASCWAPTPCRPPSSASPSSAR